MKKLNFYAGPAILHEDVLRKASEAVAELNGIGLSLVEISHRSKDFVAIMERAQQLVKQLLGVNDDYEVLFLQGGASSQFLMVPYNMLENGTAFYLDTGSWSSKAIKEARLFGNTKVVASSKDRNYRYVPKGYSIPDDAAYFHITTNNTIFGTQIHDMPDVNCPLVGDMSSDIFCKEFDASRFSLIYAGAQKNLGPAGTTLVIVRKDALDKVQRDIPTMMNYHTHIGKGSMFNTPPVFAVYVCMLTLEWLAENGGVAPMEVINRRKAQKLYDEIDRNGLLNGVADNEDRSLMNVTFTVNNEDLEAELHNLANEANIVGIKGHRSVGGFRASIYNALPESHVDTLVSVLQRFEEKFG